MLELLKSLKKVALFTHIVFFSYPFVFVFVCLLVFSLLNLIHLGVSLINHSILLIIWLELTAEV